MALDGFFQRRDHVPHELHLVLVHRMTGSGYRRIVTSAPRLRKTSFVCSTRCRGMCGSFTLQPRNTGVPVERSAVVPRSAVGTDQPAAQARDAAVSAGVPRGVFQREAGALGEPQQDDPLRRDAGVTHPGLDSPSTASAEERPGSFAAMGERKPSGYQT